MSEPMTQRELDEIRARAEKIAANKRPQFAVLFSQERDMVLNDVPRLLDEVARLREALKGAMLICETAKGMKAENERLRDQNALLEAEFDRVSRMTQTEFLCWRETVDAAREVCAEKGANDA